MAQKRSIYATDMLISLAKKLPERLMINEDPAEAAFTIAFLGRLTDEQLLELKAAVEAINDENVFIYFYIRHEGKCEPSLEFKNFDRFDFSQIDHIIFNEKAASQLLHTYLDPIHYVSVTFVVA